MSNANSVDQQIRSHHQDRRSALIAIGMTAVILIVVYFFGGKELLESAKTAEKVRQDQEFAQKGIQKNSNLVEAVQQELESIRRALVESDGKQLNFEEFRQRVEQVEQTLSTLPRLAVETREDIDAASSRNALQKAQFIAAQSLADKCEQALLQMKESTVTWETRYEPLLSNDLGRQIAADEEAVQNFATAVSGDFPVVKDSIDRMAEFEAAVRPIRDAANHGVDNYAVKASHLACIESLLSRTNDMNQRLERRRRAVDAILAITSQNDSGQLTLKQAIEHFESQTVNAMIVEATRVRKQKLKNAVDEQSETIRKAAEERIAADAQLKVQLEEVAANEAFRKSQGVAKDEALALAKDRRKQLEKEFQLELREIQGLLGAFLSEGRFQPAPGGAFESLRMEHMARDASVSLGRLSSLGALNQTEDGYEMLYRVGGHSQNDRPKSGFPNFTTNGMSNSTVVAKVKRASELLNKYGDLLLEKRLIAP